MSGEKNVVANNFIKRFQMKNYQKKRNIIRLESLDYCTDLQCRLILQWKISERLWSPNLNQLEAWDHEHQS